MNLRWLYAIAFALWSVSQGLIGLATGLGTLIAFRVLLGVGEAIYLPGGSKIVSLLFRPAERGLPSGIFDAGTRTGLVMEGVLVPWLLTRYGWRTTLRGRRVQRARVADPVVRGRAARSARRRRASWTRRIAPIGRRLAVLATNRNLVGICAAFFCFDYYWYFLVNWLPDYLVTARGLTLLPGRASTRRCRTSCSGRASRSEDGWRIGS